MKNGAKELWAAIAAISIISLVYLLVVIWQGSIPAARQFFGHSLGIVGFLLMLITETLYSLRKHSHTARWGRMADWLQFHIFTGLVGPYLALLHTAWKFDGLAGLVILLTLVIVVSGFIGRYIYTSVPRTLDGVELEAAEINNQIASTETELEAWLSQQPEVVRQKVRGLLNEPTPSSPFALVLGRAVEDLRFQNEWQEVKQLLAHPFGSQVKGLEAALIRRQELRRQVASLSVTRHLLSIWHTVHIPIGMALFATAIMHIAAALYYATLMR